MHRWNICSATAVLIAVRQLHFLEPSSSHLSFLPGIFAAFISPFVTTINPSKRWHSRDIGTKTFLGKENHQKISHPLESCGSVLENNNILLYQQQQQQHCHRYRQQRKYLSRLFSSSTFEDTTISEEDLFQEEEEEEEGFDEDDDVIGNFVQMIDATPIGELTSEDVTIIDTIMKDVTAGISMATYDDDNYDDVDNEAAELVERLLWRIVDEYEAIFDDDHDEERAQMMMPTIDMFNTAIKAWAKCGSAEKAESIVQRMQQLNDDGYDEISPDSKSFAICINAWATKQRGSSEKDEMNDATKRADDILSCMLDLHSAGHPNALPAASTFRTVIEMWSSITRDSEEGAAAEQADKLLQKLLNLYLDSDEDEDLLPDAVTFRAVIRAWANSGVDGAANRAEAVFTRMIDANVQPDAKVLRSLIDAWAKSGDDDAPEQAESVLRRMEDHGVEVTTAAYNGVIRAWGSVAGKNEEASEHILSLLAEMDNLYNDGLGESGPDVTSFNCALKALSYSKEKGVDRTAYGIFQRMESMNITPNVDSYIYLVTSLARGRGRGAAERAEDMLKRALELFPHSTSSEEKEGHISVELFNFVLTAWAKSNGEKSPKRAETLLAFMDELSGEDDSHRSLKPNVRSFTAVLDAWTQRADWEGVNHSEQILSRMIDLYFAEELDFEPDVFCWTIVLRGWSKLAKSGRRGAADRAVKLLERMESLYRDGRTSVKPDGVTFFTTMNACAYSKEPGSAEQADRLLWRMIGMYDSGDEDMKPSPVTFRVLIDSWVKSNEPSSMDRAESLSAMLKEMHETVDIETSSNVHRSLLFGWSKKENPEKAEEHLRIMIEQNLTLDSFSFDKVIEAWSQSNEPNSVQKARDIFDLMEECEGSGSVKPNERVYTSFIRALTKGGEKGLAEESRGLFNRMWKLYEEGNKGVKPTVFTYNSVLNACSTAVEHDMDERLKAFEIAIRTFNELRSSTEKPDHVTYGRMIQCSTLLPEGDKRNAVLVNSFKMCCKEGNLNSYVLRDLQESAPESIWRALVGVPAGDVSVEDLPEEWSRGKMKKR